MAALFAMLLPGLTPEAAQAQTLTPTPTSVAFGTVAVGTKNTQTIQVINPGSRSVTINSVGVAGNGLSVSGLTTPLTLTSGATHSFTLAFLPMATGSINGSVTIKHGGTQLAMISVSGTGVTSTRTLSLSTSSLNFGNDTVGQTSTLGVTLVNTGNSSLTVSGVSVSGSGFSVLSGVSGATLAAGQSSVLKVDFSPNATGTVTGSVTVTSNASNSPGSLKVSGTGVAATTSSGGTTHSVALSWVASPSANIVGYYVYRSMTSGGSYSRLISSPTNATTYTDGSVIAGDTYYYVVTAVNSSGAESADSNQVTAVIP